MRKRKLSKGQINRLSEITGNTSVAWFSIGVIAPLFVRQESLEFIATIIVSLFMTGVFGSISIYLMKGVK